MNLAGPSAIGDATRAARDFAAAQRIGGTDAARLAILVEELVTNLYEHGGAGDTVELALSRAVDSISLTISDQGAPFDPRSAPPPGAIPERGGGAGLALVRSWARVSNYAVGEDGNRLTISLPIKPS